MNVVNIVGLILVIGFLICIKKENKFYAIEKNGFKYVKISKCITLLFSLLFFVGLGLVIYLFKISLDKGFNKEIIIGINILVSSLLMISVIYLLLKVKLELKFNDDKIIFRKKEYKFNDIQNVEVKSGKNKLVILFKDGKKKSFFPTVRGYGEFKEILHKKGYLN